MSLPGIPQGLYITTGNGTNCINWQLVAGATTYSVQRSTDGVNFTTVATPTTPFYLDTAVTAGTQYWYQIASTSSGGTSPYASVGTNGAVLTITPCLPGQINLGYLRYMSKLRADKLNSQFLTDDEWNFNINQSAKKLYDLLTLKYGEKYFLAPPLQIPTSTFFLNQGMAYIPFPNGILYNNAPAFYKLVGVDCSINPGNGQWFTLPNFNWIDRNKYATLQVAGTVQSVYGFAYCENGSNLWFIPQPQASLYIQLWYIQLMTEMVLDTDMMAFSLSGWSEIVMLDAAVKALIKEESYEQAQALAVERGGVLDRIQETAANRDVGQPNTVSNTRARAGDPNFGTLFGGFGGWGSGGGSGWG